MTIVTKDLNLKEVIAKYPEIPRLIILKTDAQRRGVYYTERALSVLDERLHAISGDPYLRRARRHHFAPS